MALRERKKAQTRRRISDVATGLFLARGFDRVSVAEVAEAADVSKMTVFNYFPRKEDLMFDRFPEMVELVTAAVRGRQEGEPPVSAIHRMLRDLVDRDHPLGGPRDGDRPFLRTVQDSPALLARAREFRDELTTVLTDLTGGDHRAHLTAALTVAAWQSVFTTSTRRLLAGAPPADLARDHLARLDEAFEAVAHATGPPRT
ncbi:TetR/AcrR family transcriptional regulator [Pseudonocardia acaciae]|uniref:TetR/AcrR family transcriptional regulator n=1 Tax=Pseudonocardia acaciae TaxID=551276 RepID=UPI0005623CC2|nr:TetR/AcrR family transcriptional regulator [Pseudonocardia acaciae]